MSNCFLWILLLCCCGTKNESTSCGRADTANKKPCGCGGTKLQNSCKERGGFPPRPHCVMPAEERFICKADSEETFLDEKECE